MTRGTALVSTVARVVQLTGRQDLAELEADGELTLTDLLVTASDAIYDQLEADGIDPTKLTNAEVYERAVAWHFLAILVIGGYLDLQEGQDPPKNEQGQADAYAWSDPYYLRVRPSLSEGDANVGGGVVPRVGNLRQRSAFDSSAARGGTYWATRPARRT